MKSLNAKNVLRVFMKNDGQLVLDYYRKDQYDKYLYVAIESNNIDNNTKSQYKLYKRNLKNYNTKEVTLGFKFNFYKLAGYSWGNKKNKKINIHKIILIIN